MFFSKRKKKQENIIINGPLDFKKDFEYIMEIIELCVSTYIDSKNNKNINDEVQSLYIPEDNNTILNDSMSIFDIVYNMIGDGPLQRFKKIYIKDIEAYIKLKINIAYDIVIVKHKELKVEHSRNELKKGGKKNSITYKKIVFDDILDTNDYTYESFIDAHKTYGGNTHDIQEWTSEEIKNEHEKYISCILMLEENNISLDNVDDIKGVS